MRLIDADALIEDLKTQFRDMRKLLKTAESTEFQRYMMRVRMGRLVSNVVSISAAPTVDAVPVIRCKDCKYYNSQQHYCEGIGNWFGYVGEWSDNGYCYKAERKEQ